MKETILKEKLQKNPVVKKKERERISISKMNTKKKKIKMHKEKKNQDASIDKKVNKEISCSVSH